ncbi:hypothetical protein Zmor_020486 [Zophobas morio]|uniref:Odorant receptor n=1 Tax=Zophobas morio TaxID=2755281 RepID=A0AA38I3X9_9CUCU|nr:hypothetical protein Zmor_020486 [Zophobas morio]
MEKFDWKETIKRNIFMLKILGLWPSGNTYTIDVYSTYSLISILAFIYGHNFFQAINIYFIFPDLEAIAGTIFVTLSEMLTMVKTYYVVQNMQMLKQLMVDINEDHFQPRNSTQIKMIEPSLNFWKTTSTLLWGMSGGAVFFWATYPILDGSVKENRLPFLAWYPYDTTISPFYEITYIYQIISVAFIAATTLTIDTLIAALNVFIGAQCDILCDNLKYVFVEDRLNASVAKLLSCFNHHKEILRFAYDSNNFFNWIVFVQFFISGASIGITMFQLTITTPFSSEFFSLVTFGNAIIVEIFMYCWFGNEVEIKSANIPVAIFHSDWLKAAEKTKKDMVFFLMRCQRPIKMSALNLFYLSLETFVRILRTSWSYFALLNQVGA